MVGLHIYNRSVFGAFALALMETAHSALIQSSASYLPLPDFLPGSPSAGPTYRPSPRPTRLYQLFKTQAKPRPVVHDVIDVRTRGCPGVKRCLPSPAPEAVALPRSRPAWSQPVCSCHVCPW